MIDLRNLNVNSNRRKWTTGKAPHKAVFILTCIKLFENNRLDLKNVLFTDSNIIQTYRDIWRCLDYEKPGRLTNPMYHLVKDGFYRMGQTIEPELETAVGLSAMQNLFDHAEFSDEFVEMVSNHGRRKKAVEDLLHGGYFSCQEIIRLEAELGVLDRSFEIDVELETSVLSEFVKEAPSFPGRQRTIASARNHSFRRLVISAYSNRCSVCGLSVINDEGVSPIDAAHILPHAEFRNDDPRNGVALCKLHHWAFDNAMLSISPKYLVKVPRIIKGEFPKRILTGLARQRIKLPDNEHYHPARKALEWHNKHRYGNGK